MVMMKNARNKIIFEIQNTKFELFFPLYLFRFNKLIYPIEHTIVYSYT